MSKLNLDTLRSFLPRRKSKLYRMDRFQKILVVFLTLFGVLMLLPLIYIFNHAFKPFHELFIFPPTFIVQEPTFKNFIDMVSFTEMSVVPVTRYLFNSVIVAAGAVIGVTVISALCAYPLSKMNFPGNKIVFSTIILALMFTADAVETPRYIIASSLGIVNTYWGHLLPLMAMPVGVFLLKQFIDQIPNELLEAAKMDGATELSLFFRIVIPMCMPAVATVAILMFQTAWNDTRTSTLFMQEEAMKTFAFYISSIAAGMASNIGRQGMIAAAALLLFIPNMIIFLVFQRKVIATMAHSGIK